jgi:hypothetical protein
MKGEAEIKQGLCLKKFKGAVSKATENIRLLFIQPLNLMLKR